MDDKVWPFTDSFLLAFWYFLKWKYGDFYSTILTLGHIRSNVLVGIFSVFIICIKMV